MTLPVATNAVARSPQSCRHASVSLVATAKPTYILGRDTRTLMSAMSHTTTSKALRGRDARTLRSTMSNATTTKALQSGIPNE